MTLTAEKLPFRGDTIQQLLATVDRVTGSLTCANCGVRIVRLPLGGSMHVTGNVTFYARCHQPFVHTTCQWEQEGYAFPCGRKAHHTCTVCEVTQCDRHDCGCER